MNALSPKVEARHLRLRAIVYVRQSTPRQVQVNRESTRRQYQLAERARQMGWPAAQIEVIDEDLGLSGASSHARTGFQRLVAAIGLGEVGIVLVTEVSRLSRRNSDWHRVIELCAVFRTLIADEDGVYCAHDPNDRLLLGVKGTLFAAELHILHARMRGNLLNKARRGELALRLPVGYRRLGDGTVVLDPDDGVRDALARIFERFAVLRNGRAVQRDLIEHDLRMPRLVQLGAEAGRITWVRPTYQMIQQVLTSPVYAGVFVYGRRKQEMTPGDPPTVTARRQALEEWEIVVPGIYPAYISYDQYLLNRRHLKDNLYKFAAKGRGAPREGRALLQGIVV
jgi:DNA invertase Pin-like site-specific DNA recombinase